MDIIVTIVTATVAGALSGTAASLLTGYVTRKKSHTLLQKRLDGFYSPLAKMLRNDSNITCAEMSASISRLVSENFDIAPWFLKEFAEKPYSDDTGLVKNNRDLCAHIESNYNWLQKMMGHDYDEKHIDKKYLPDYKLKQDTAKAIFFIFNIAVLAITVYFAACIVRAGNLDEIIYSSGLFIGIGWLMSSLISFIISKWIS